MESYCLVVVCLCAPGKLQFFTYVMRLIVSFVTRCSNNHVKLNSNNIRELVVDCSASNMDAALNSEIWIPHTQVQTLSTGMTHGAKPKNQFPSKCA